MSISVPAGQSALMPPAALVSRIWLRAEAAHEQHRLDDQPLGVALVQVQAALEADDRHALELAEQQPAGVARRRRGRPTGQLGEWHGCTSVERVGQAAQA